MTHKEAELRQLFKNNFDIYGDAQGDVVLAMTENKFVEIVNQLATEVLQEGGGMEALAIKTAAIDWSYHQTMPVAYPIEVKEESEYRTPEFAAETYAMGKVNHHQDSEKWMELYCAFMEGTKWGLSHQPTQRELMNQDELWMAIITKWRDYKETTFEFIQEMKSKYTIQRN